MRRVYPTLIGCRMDDFRGDAISGAGESAVGHSTARDTGSRPTVPSSSALVPLAGRPDDAATVAVDTVQEHPNLIIARRGVFRQPKGAIIPNGPCWLPRGCWRETVLRTGVPTLGDWHIGISINDKPGNGVIMIKRRIRLPQERQFNRFSRPISTAVWQRQA